MIASLWPVADVSTSLLMREFYRIREASNGMTKSEALREAQLELLRGTASSQTGSGRNRGVMHESEIARHATAPAFQRKPNAPYSHPYFWAPFFLMGNWL